MREERKLFKLFKSPGQEQQKIFKANFAIDKDANGQKLLGFGWSSLSNIDPNPDNYCGAAILHTSTTQYGCLYRLEPNKQAQVCIFFFADFYV